MYLFGCLLRVSSDRQREEETIEIQDDVGRKFFIALGYDPDKDVLWFYDDGVSGDIPIWQRPGGKKLKAAIESGQITQAVFVYRIDRINREDVRSYFELEAICEEYGLSLRSIIEGIDTSTDGGQLAGGVLALASRIVKRQLTQHLHARKLLKVEKGDWVSKPPYGYRLVDRRLVVEPVEAAIVVSIFRMYTEQQFSAAAITDALNGEGKRTRGTKKFPGGKPWNVRSIIYLLQNTVYVGIGNYNRKQNVRKQGKFLGQRKRPEEEWLTVATPDIISDEMFAIAQARREEAANYGGWKAKTPFLLRGFLRCVRCQRLFGGKHTSRPSTYNYYRHGTRYDCEFRKLHFYLEPTDDEVWRKVVEASQNPDTWLELLRDQYQQDNGREEAIAALQEVEKQQLETAEQEELLVSALLRKTLSEAIYDRKVAELRTLQARLNREHKMLLGRLSELPERETLAIETLRKHVDDINADASLETKRVILGELIDTIWVDVRAGEVHLRIEPR